jgi:hypothetical protein
MGTTYRNRELYGNEAPYGAKKKKPVALAKRKKKRVGGEGARENISVYERESHIQDHST